MMKSMAHARTFWLLFVIAALAGAAVGYGQSEAPKDDWLTILKPGKDAGPAKTSAAPPASTVQQGSVIAPREAKPGDVRVEGAAVDVEMYRPTPLMPVNPDPQLAPRPGGWLRVPDFLGKDAQIYSLTSLPYEDVSAGVSKVRVTKAGLMIIACHFGYEGTLAGGWRETTLTLEQLTGLGFKPVGTAVSTKGRDYVLMAREMKADEQMNLRVNKFEPPYVITMKTFVMPDPKAPVNTVTVSGGPLVWGSPLTASKGTMAVTKVYGFAPVKMNATTRFSESQPLWPQLPDKFKDATIFSAEPPQRLISHGLAADFSVDAEGQVYLACQPTRSTYKPFDGRLSTDELTQGGWVADGEIKDDKDNTFQLFYKYVKPGEAYRIRVNRQTPVYVIVNNKKT